MSIPQADVKKLWALAAGHCSRLGCDEDCVPFLKESEPTLVGEMAHIIGQSPNGPRSLGSAGQDSYENLILLCPTCHTRVDRAPLGTYSADTLRDWKARHEARVRKAIVTPSFRDKNDLCAHVERLLTENRTVWTTYGPESLEAQSNPLSNASAIWELRKLSTIVPNNRRIVDIVRRDRAWFTSVEYDACCRFVEHAEGFERNCYETSEGVPRFPREFAEMIASHV